MLRKVTKLVKGNLVGLDGNAFYLMGWFKKQAERQGTPKEEIEAVLKECKGESYEHLICTLLDNLDNNYETDDDGSLYIKGKE